MNAINGRLSEPSTWAGFAAVLEAVKLFMPQYSALIVGLQTLMGAVAVVVRESANKAASGG